MVWRLVAKALGPVVVVPKAISTDTPGFPTNRLGPSQKLTAKATTLWSCTESISDHENENGQYSGATCCNSHWFLYAMAAGGSCYLEVVKLVKMFEFVNVAGSAIHLFIQALRYRLGEVFLVLVLSLSTFFSWHVHGQQGKFKPLATSQHVFI